MNNPHILGTERIGKLLVQYSIPAIIGMTITSLYNIIDSIFIGHGVGPMGIAGLAITFPLMNLVVAFCTMVSAGGSTISSIRLGQKDLDGATEVLGNTLMFCLVNAFIFGGISFIFLDDILRFFGASNDTLPYARDFMQVILLGTPVYNPQIQISAESETKRSIFREKDKTKRSKKESAQHSKSRNKSFVMTSVSAL